MVWHVASDTPLEDASERSNLKYYTRNQFLGRHGSTLQSLYSSYYPMENIGNFFYQLLLARGVAGA